MIILLIYTYNMAKWSKHIKGKHHFMSSWQSLRSFPNSIESGKVAAVYLKLKTYLSLKWSSRACISLQPKSLLYVSNLSFTKQSLSFCGKQRCLFPIKGVYFYPKRLCLSARLITYGMNGAPAWMQPCTNRRHIPSTVNAEPNYLITLPPPRRHHGTAHRERQMYVSQGEQFSVVLPLAIFLRLLRSFYLIFFKLNIQDGSGPKPTTTTLWRQH